MRPLAVISDANIKGRLLVSNQFSNAQKRVSFGANWRNNRFQPMRALLQDEDEILSQNNSLPIKCTELVVIGSELDADHSGPFRRFIEDLAPHKKTIPIHDHKILNLAENMIENFRLYLCGREPCFDVQKAIDQSK